MRITKRIERVPFPEMELTENFSFTCACSDGAFTFAFKWLNDRWNLWVTLPDGSIREAGMQPNVTSWSGFTDYSLYIQTDLTTIDYPSLFLCEIFLISWE